MHMLTTTKQNPAKKGACYLPFVMDAMESIRGYCINDAAIRIHIDATAKTVISFTAEWLEKTIKLRPIPRRVYLETKTTHDGKYTLIFMAKSFDEKAVVVTYSPAAFGEIARDVQQYLRLDKLPQFEPELA
jgi:hypothetical protein